MGSEINDDLTRRLATGSLQIGQILCSPDFSICHADDEGKACVEIYTDPYQAGEISKYDPEGNYRPLKTAPNLRQGWRLKLASIEEVRLAIDLIYPLALPAILAFGKNALPVSSLRSVLDRQTGMYAVTKKLSDEEADEVVQRLCNSLTGCLRHVLWTISEGRPSPFTEGRDDIPQSPQKIPLLCPEACCLVVAEARSVVKKRPPVPVEAD